MFASVLISCVNSPTFVPARPKKIIPNLPSNVYYKITDIPKGPLNEQQTAEFIRQYELNEQHNKRAIDTAKKAYKKAQEVYSK